MRIVMLAQFYPPTVGGEERHVQGLSRELAARGHDVAVATLGTEESDSEIDHGVRVYRIRTTMQRVPGAFVDSARPHVPPFPDPEAIAALRRIIVRERPDIVHAHNWLVHSFLPLKRWSNAKLVMTLHDYSLVCAKKRLMYRNEPCSGPGLKKCLECASDHYGPVKGVPTVLSNWGMSFVERRAVDMFIAVSQATADGNRIVEARLPYQVIPNFIPDDLGTCRGKWDARLAELPSDNYLLYVGDISHDKGAHTLLQAYNNLTDAPPLVLIGRLTPEVKALLPDNVIHVGPWPNDVVMEARYRSLITLAPSRWAEPFGIVVLEAMAAGRPVIASNIGGLTDIVVPEETGLLVPPGDSIALQRAIERLLADPALRERLGQMGRERVNMFRASTVIPTIEAVYREVCHVPVVPDVAMPSSTPAHDRALT
ncbi:MAG: glycosyltransferase family 4 protein [Chloroflexota bacterium]